MSARGFRSITMVAGVAGAALSCYMVSLRVASERAALEDVENRIVLAQRDIRVLQTEIGTRGRLAQLESWNVKVLALSAPEANQFVEGGFALASMVAPKKTVDPAAPVVLASAPAPENRPRLTSDGPDAGVAAKDLMRVASFRRDLGAAAPEPKLAAPAVKPAAENAKKTVEKTAVTKASSEAKPIKAAKPKPVTVKETAVVKPTGKAAGAATKPAPAKPATASKASSPAKSAIGTKDVKAKQ
ncbi:hypothetical protein ACFQPG_04340 [Sphingomonas sp. GCM10030256]|uniref:hypothetical protein n=1 Tax=Sphingomonas sp. GCM10030256 TaxID=3273427 RepID=UPI00361C5E08